MEFPAKQTVNPCTSSINNQNEFVEKLSLDIFKAENETVFKQKVNDEWDLKITDELYTECDQLIEEKINLIRDLKTENEHITHEMRNNSEIQLKLDGEKEHLQKNFMKCKEYFNRLQDILQICKKTDLDLKKKINEIQDGIHSYKQNEKENTEKYSDKITSLIQLIGSENMRFIKALKKIKGHFEKIDEQLIDIKDQEQKLQESRSELENKKQLYKQENKIVQDDIDDILAKFAELKEKYEECIQEHESDKMKHDIRIGELKTKTDKDNKRHNIQMTEVQNKQSNLESAIIDAEELLVSLQNELNNYETELNQQSEDREEEILSKLDNIKELKNNYKILYDTNTFLKKKCVDGEDMTATLKNRIKDSIDNKASAENNLVKNKREIEENEKSYIDIINEYTKKSDEIRVENEELLNIRKTLNQEIECKEQEYNDYKNQMESILNQYRESAENAKKSLEDWTLKADELKKIVNDSDEELKNMEVAVEKKCKLMEEESEQKIQNLSKDHEKFKTASNELAKTKQGNYLSEIKSLHEARQNKHTQINELKSIKSNLQIELGIHIDEISRLSTEIENRNKETVAVKSSAVQLSGIEKLIEPEIPTLTPKDRVNLLTESSDDTFKYRPVIDTESEWQKLLNQTSAKLQPPVRPKLTLSKPGVKYDMSWKDSDSDISDSSKDKSDELFVPIRTKSPMFKQPPIRRPTRASQKSRTRKPVY
ncbi:hypothetical protein CBL_09339 [Carabus blaptoides fortunei]